MKNIKNIALVLLFLHATPFIFSSEETTQKPIFLWDIHGVLLRPDIKILLSGLWSYPHKWQLLTNGSLMYKIVQLLWEHLGSEVISTDYIDLAEQYSPEFKELINLWGTAYTLIPDSVEFVKQLKECGYTHHVGSNIDKRIFDAMLERYPEIKKFFTENFDLEHTQTTSKNEKSNIVKKPQARYFTRYLKEINNEEFKESPGVFIDDRVNNVIAAKKVGFEGIHFTSAEKLREEVVEYLKKNNQPIPICTPHY